MTHTSTTAVQTRRLRDMTDSFTSFRKRERRWRLRRNAVARVAGRRPLSANQQRRHVGTLRRDPRDDEAIDELLAALLIRSTSHQTAG